MNSTDPKQPDRPARGRSHETPEVKQLRAAIVAEAKKDAKREQIQQRLTELETAPPNETEHETITRNQCIKVLNEKLKEINLS